MATIKDIISKIDGASAAFDGVITKTEKKLFDSVVGQVKLLDIDGMGHIKTTTANLKLLSDISVKLQQMTSKDKEYLSGVKSLAKAFDDIYKAQAAFYAVHFAEKTLNDKAKAKYEAMKRVAVTNTVSGLTGAGLQSYVLDPLSKTLLRAVTSGSKYSDLVLELRRQLTSADKEHQSALAKYAKTYATTALTQYAGQNNKLFTDDLKTEWFEYVGSEIETTREFCHHLTNKRYIHVSELSSILDGKIEYDGTVHHCKMNPKTGLPAGLIEGTTPENFQVNVGGWNCRHQLVPVAKEAVPKDIRAKFDSHTAEEIAKQKAEEEKKKKVAELKAKLEKYEQWKDADAPGINEAVQNGDLSGLEGYLDKMEAVQKQLSQMNLLDAPEKAAQQFTVAELQAVQDAVAAKLAQFDAKGFTGQKLVEKLQFEADWVEQNKKYPTWQVAQQAYSKKLAEVQTEIAMASVKSDYIHLLDEKVKSKQFKQQLSELGEAVANSDLEKAKKLVVELKQKFELLAKRRTQYAVKHGKPINEVTFDAEAFSQTRKDNAMWYKGARARENTDAALRQKTCEAWLSASEVEKDAAFGYTAGSYYLNEPLRGQNYIGGKGGREKFINHANALTSLISRCTYKFDKWIQRGGSRREILGRFGVDLDSYVPKDSRGFQTDGVVTMLEGKTGVEHAFLSTGSCKGNGFSGDVIMNIYCPRGTQGIYCEPFSYYGHGVMGKPGQNYDAGRKWDGKHGQTEFGREFETLLQRETEFRIIKAEYKYGTWYLDMEVISQKPQPLTDAQIACS